jgi:uncharacterized protein with HEPN domain
MKELDALTFIEHILESIAYIEEDTDGVTQNAFLEDRTKQDAVIRRLEIIGEATKHIPEKFRDAHPDIPWKRMAGMRDVLIHDYLGVDLAIVWNVVQRELPELNTKLRRIMSGE